MLELNQGIHLLAIVVGYAYLTYWAFKSGRLLTNCVWWGWVDASWAFRQVTELRTAARAWLTFKYFWFTAWDTLKNELNSIERVR